MKDLSRIKNQINKSFSIYSLVGADGIVEKAIPLCILVSKTISDER
jgi:hypothetical protein